MATSTDRPATRAAWRRDPRSEGHVAAWVAWGTCAGYWAAIGTGYALRLSSGTASDVIDELGWRIAYGSCATVGAVIASRRSRNVIGWILCAIGISSAVAAFAQDYAILALLAARRRCRVAW